jgi:hypothetical protein
LPKQTDTLLGNAAPQSDGATKPAGSKAEPEKASPPVVGLAPLPDNATEDQRKDFEQKLRALGGVPDKPEGYGDFGFGEAMKIDAASADYKYYTGVFHELGLNQGQAKKLLEAHMKYATNQVEHARKQEDAAIAEYRTMVKSDFVKSLGGEGQFKDFREVAERGFKAAAKGSGMNEKEITGLLNIMGDDPRFIKVFNGVGKLLREDVLITGTQPAAKEKTFDDMFAGMFGKQGG